MLKPLALACLGASIGLSCAPPSDTLRIRGTPPAASPPQAVVALLEGECRATSGGPATCAVRIQNISDQPVGGIAVNVDVVDPGGRVKATCASQLTTGPLPPRQEHSASFLCSSPSDPPAGFRFRFLDSSRTQPDGSLLPLSTRDDRGK